MKPYSVDQLPVRRFLLGTQHLLPQNNAANTAFADAQTALQMINKLECVQIDPISAVERNQHLVLAARIPGYQPEHLDQLLSQGNVFEYMANAACVIPIEDYPIFEPIRNRFREKLQAPLDELGQVTEDVLGRFKSEGPLPSRAFKSKNRVHGYWDNKMPATKETSHALNLLLDSGVIRVVHREGMERFFDLTERSIPKTVLHKSEIIGTPNAYQALIEKYMRAYRVFDPRDARFGWHKMTAARRRLEVEQRVEKGTVIPLQITDVKHHYFILAEDLDKLESISKTIRNDRDPMEGMIRFLPPLDNLLWRRERLADLFDFNYKWEIYTPRIKRRYGSYAMPILYGDRLIGRIDPRIDRKSEKLVIRLLQIEPSVTITAHLQKAMRDALQSFAESHRVQEFVVEKTEPPDLSF